MLHLPDEVWRKVSRYTKGTHWALWTYLITPAAILSLVGVLIISTVSFSQSSQSTSTWSLPSDCQPCPWLLPSLPLSHRPGNCQGSTQAWSAPIDSDLPSDSVLVAEVTIAQGEGRSQSAVIAVFPRYGPTVEVLLQSVDGRLSLTPLSDIPRFFLLSPC